MLFNPFIWAFRIGLYQLSTIIWHLPFVGLGLFIRLKLRTRRSRWIWLGALVLMVVACDIAWAQIAGFDRIGVCLAAAGVMDLVLGTALIGISHTIRRWIPFRK